MKIRNGFVTNSSSSSFILAFKDEDDYVAFQKECEELYYKEIYKLVNRMKKSNKKDIDTLKNEIKKEVYHWLTYDETREYCRSKMEKGLSFPEQIEEEKRIQETEEFKKHMEEYIATTNFLEKVEKIEEATILVEGTIWDSSGGILEYAIRNGILRNYVFRQWLVDQIDID